VYRAGKMWLKMAYDGHRILIIYGFEEKLLAYQPACAALVTFHHGFLAVTFELQEINDVVAKTKAFGAVHPLVVFEVGIFFM